MIRDEAILRTACGCEKIVSAPNNGWDMTQTAIHAGRNVAVKPTEDWLSGDATYRIRRFRFEGEFDRMNRRIFQEVINPDDRDWKAEYQKLYEAVYGMDKGL